MDRVPRINEDFEATYYYTYVKWGLVSKFFHVHFHVTLSQSYIFYHSNVSILINVYKFRAIN